MILIVVCACYGYTHTMPDICHLYFIPEDLHWAMTLVLAETSSLTCCLWFTWCLATLNTLVIPVATPKQTAKRNT